MDHALHHMLGFWAFLLILLWALTGIYFAFPDGFISLSEWLHDGDQEMLAMLSRLHFGRAYGLFVKLLWTVLGLIPCALFITGVMMWLHRKARGVSARG